MSWSEEDKSGVVITADSTHSLYRISPALLEEQREIAARIAAGQTERRRYHISTFGCQQNEHDSEHMAGHLELMGLSPADGVESADLVILNTCAVRENAAQRFLGHLGALKPLLRNNPRLIVGVGGCLAMQPDIREQIRRSFNFVRLIFSPNDIWRLPELFEPYLLEKSTARRYDPEERDTLAEQQPTVRGQRFRALCSIMTGCNNFCSYCIVPFARGRERSRHPESIMREIRDIAARGIPEVMLLGQNVNSWGHDLRKEGIIASTKSFADLIAAVASVSGIERVRFMTSHPKDISDELISVIAQHKNIERHIHLPLQSGSDKILRAMNRRYTAERYMEIVRVAREQIPDLALTTDIIVGFPGETEDDFAETLRIVREVRFSAAFMFMFSPRPGTAAADLPPVEPEVVAERFNRLLELQNSITLEESERLLGGEYRVIVEGVSGRESGMLMGRMSDNHLVHFSVPDAVWANYAGEAGRLPAVEDLGVQLTGRIVTVRPYEARIFSLTGEAVEIERNDGGRTSE